jgi:hypothetical protein
LYPTGGAAGARPRAQEKHDTTVRAEGATLSCRN